MLFGAGKQERKDITPNKYAWNKGKKIVEVLSVPIAHNTEEVSDNFLLSKVSILISKSYWKIE